MAMFVLATDWVTISSLATAAGTLVLAIATFAALRSANRSAQIAEVALQEQRRPILIPSRFDDPAQKLNFSDGQWVHTDGGHAEALHVDGRVYLAISLRNVGSGLGVCQGWAARAGASFSTAAPHPMPDTAFHTQTRDLYIPGGDIGMWQGALRNPDDPLRAELAGAIDDGRIITIELLYSDLTGRQRAITRFGLMPKEDGWLASMSRHWFLDMDGPRPSSQALDEAIATLHDETSEADDRHLSK